jgi:hypothetical protein
MSATELKIRSSLLNRKEGTPIQFILASNIHKNDDY